jgi:hypothetical protein
MVGKSIIRGFLGCGEKKDLRFHLSNLRRPDCSLAMETVFAIGQNIRIMFGLMVLFMKEQKISGRFGFCLLVRAWVRLLEGSLLCWM